MLKAKYKQNREILILRDVSAVAALLY